MQEFWRTLIVITLTKRNVAIRLSQLCCCGHVNGAPLTQMQWYVNAVFRLYWQRIFFLWSWKTALRSPRIATLTKTQHIHCTKFAEEILSYTLRIVALTMEFVGIWIVWYAELKQAERSERSMYMVYIHFGVIIFKYAPNFLNTLFILFLPEDACNQNLVWNSVLYPFDQRCLPYAGESFKIRTLKSPCSCVLPFIY